MIKAWMQTRYNSRTIFTPSTPVYHGNRKVTVSTVDAGLEGASLLNVAVRRHNVALPAAFVFHSKGREAWEWNDFADGLGKNQTGPWCGVICRPDVRVNSATSTGRKLEGYSDRYTGKSPSSHILPWGRGESLLNLDNSKRTDYEMQS